MCFSVMFLEHEERTDSKFMFTRQVEMSLDENNKMLVMFSSLRINSEVVSFKLSIVSDFHDFFRVLVVCRRSVIWSSP